MNALPRRVLGRTEASVPFLWQPIGPGAYGASDFCALFVSPEVLERRGDPVLEAALAKLGRESCDLLVVEDILASDIKVGWPMHRLQQLRDRRLCRWFGVETQAPLEAEWIAGNAPVHAVIARFSASDMSIRYRTFESAHNGGVALVARADSIADVQLHLATPQIVASVTDFHPTEPIAPLDATAVEALWANYQLREPAPPKLRLGHPPEYGA